MNAVVSTSYAERYSVKSCSTGPALLKAEKDLGEGHRGCCEFDIGIRPGNKKCAPCNQSVLVLKPAGMYLQQKASSQV